LCVAVAVEWGTLLSFQVWFTLVCILNKARRTRGFMGFCLHFHFPDENENTKSLRENYSILFIP
jgi:hypothetical protein